MVIILDSLDAGDLLDRYVRLLLPKRHNGLRGLDWLRFGVHTLH